MLFESYITPSDPAWLTDHRVFGRLVAPGAMYAAMAAMALRSEGAESVVMEDMQLHSPLIFPEDSANDGHQQDTRQLQLVLDPADESRTRRVEIFSKGAEEGWTLHVEGRLSRGTRTEEASERSDLESLKAGLSSQGVPEFFETKSGSGLEFGPAFRGLEALWFGSGEALGEIALRESVGANGLDVHPLLIDGCFQVMSATRDFTRGEVSTAYMPFGWERLWLSGSLPDRIICHARTRESSRAREPESPEPPEALTADLWLYDPYGLPIGAFIGFTSKRATRAALLSFSEDLNDLLYEISWRNDSFTGGLQPADFLSKPSEVAAQVRTYSDYLTEVGIPPAERVEMLADLERLSQSYALRGLERLGWNRIKGNSVVADALLETLRIEPVHERLLGRMLQMLCDAGVLQEEPTSGFKVTVGADEPLPNGMVKNPDDQAAALEGKFPYGQNEIAVLRRCASRLDEVLTGMTDPVGLVFVENEPSASE